MYKHNKPRKGFFKKEFLDEVDKSTLLEPVEVKKVFAWQPTYSIQDGMVEFTKYLA